MSDSNLVTTPAEVGMKLRQESSGSFIDPTIYKSLFRSLRYLIITKPDIMFAVGLVS